jgi:hypothetical protein
MDRQEIDEVEAVDYAQARGADILLVTCVKTKQKRPAAAKDLYTSPLFKKQRAYAEARSMPWFILSAEYGLVAPDEWLAPYERFLPETPASFRNAWAAWVAARLELLTGTVETKIIEIHAGAPYLSVLAPALVARGASIRDPLCGLSLGERLAWYSARSAGREEAVVDDESIVTALLDEASSLPPEDFLGSGRTAANTAGLYSWWVDEQGADDISRGLGMPFSEGLIYAGLAGATRWPSGTRSQSTLWLRIATMHLAGSHEFSTFRRTLGAIHASASGSSRVNEEALSTWMSEHLRVVTVPFTDRDELGKLETRVLKALDPPLNLQGMTTSDVRQRLKVLRRIVTNE